MDEGNEIGGRRVTRQCAGCSQLLWLVTNCCAAVRYAALAALLTFGTPQLAWSQAALDELRAVQQALQSRGYDVGPIDGIAGPRTKTAIEEFQRKQGLPVSGGSDEATMRALGLRPTAQIPRAAEPVQQRPPATAPTAPAPSATTTPPRPAPPAAASAPPPATSASSSSGGGGGWIALLTIGALLFFLLRRKKSVSPATEGARAEKPEAAWPKPRPNTKAVDAAAASESAPLTITISTSSETYSIDERSWGKPRPTLDELRLEGERCWVPGSRGLTVRGYELRRGLVYVGKTLRRQDGYGSEGCLIDPDLAVVESRGLMPQFSYFRAYSHLQPDARGAYLRWLASERDDPLADSGYVLLYLHGIERRLLLEEPGDEYEGLIAEVDRIHELYQKDYTVDRHARQLLDVARLARSPQKAYERDAPFNRNDYELPMAVRLAIGQLLADAKPVPWQWMYAWVINDHETSIRTVHTRADQEIQELFRVRFLKKYPDGFKLSAPKTRLKWMYRAISGSFEIDLQSKIGELPDVVNLRGPTNRMRELLDECAADLDAYSRYLGRNPNGRDTAQALALLPAEIASTADGQLIKDIRSWLDGLLQNGSATVESGELLKRLGVEAPNYGKAAIRSCADVLRNLNVAMIPNPRVSLQLPKLGQPFVLYRCALAEMPENEIAAFRRATLTLTFAAFVVHADEALTDSEAGGLRAFIDATSGLGERARADLVAHLKWLQAVPVELGPLRGRLSSLTAEDRQQLGLVALTAASADASVQPAEIKALERIYKMLGLDEKQVLSDLHSSMAQTGSATGLTVVQLGSNNARSGYAIPKPVSVADLQPAKTSNDIHLDAERLKRIGESTQRVNEILARVFEESDAEPITVVGEVKAEDMPDDEAVAASSEPTFEGLDPRYKKFTAELLTQDEWDRDDLDALARRHELMTDGALEAVNEWAFDKYGEALLDDGSPTIVHAHLVTSNPAVANV